MVTSYFEFEVLYYYRTVLLLAYHRHATTVAVTRSASARGGSREMIGA